MVFFTFLVAGVAAAAGCGLGSSASSLSGSGDSFLRPTLRPPRPPTGVSGGGAAFLLGVCFFFTDFLAPLGVVVQEGVLEAAADFFPIRGVLLSVFCRLRGGGPSSSISSIILSMLSSSLKLCTGRDRFPDDGVEAIGGGGVDRLAAAAFLAGVFMGVSNFAGEGGLMDLFRGGTISDSSGASL